MNQTPLPFDVEGLPHAAPTPAEKFTKSHFVMFQCEFYGDEDCCEDIYNPYPCENRFAHAEAYCPICTQELELIEHPDWLSLQCTACCLTYIENASWTDDPEEWQGTWTNPTDAKCQATKTTRRYNYECELSSWHTENHSWIRKESTHAQAA